MKKMIFFIVISSLFALACNNTTPQEEKNNVSFVKYAENFSIDTTNDGYCISTKNRFDNSFSQKYYLSRNNIKNGEENKIHIPVKKIICLSTTHCAFIRTLSEENSILGISGTKYIYDSTINKKIEQGEIIEVGYENQINYEKIISLKPDIIFAYAVDNNSTATLEKLNASNIPIIYVSEFIETQPLGRTEWIKFFACFYDKLPESTIFFDSVSNNYNSIKKLVSENVEKKPKVITGLPYKGTWWLPSKSSFFANFLSDAGADYLFNRESKNNESMPISLENVFDIAKEADFWLNPNDCYTKKDILNVDKRIKNFDVFNKAKIYNNFKRTNKNGGCDFWESGIVHPDIILNDLVSIFYNKNDELIYYFEVK